VSPFGISAAVAARAIERAGWAGAGAIGPRLAAGELVATVAWHEDDGLPAIDAPAVRLAPAGDGFALDGHKRAVPFGAEAGLLLVPATMDAGHALVALQVDAQAQATAGAGRLEGVPAPAIDGMPSADIRFDALPIPASAVVARGEDARGLLGWMRDAWRVASCADALGAMRRLVEMTGEYLRVRQQFGAPIGQNQALRHRFVDLHLAIREVEATCEYAAVSLDRADAQARAHAADIAHYATVRAAWRVSQECVQMHGGIGMAAETPVGGYFKRLLGFALRCGDEDAALARLAARCPSAAAGRPAAGGRRADCRCRRSRASRRARRRPPRRLRSRRAGRPATRRVRPRRMRPGPGRRIPGAPCSRRRASRGSAA